MPGVLPDRPVVGALQIRPLFSALCSPTRTRVRKSGALYKEKPRRGFFFWRGEGGAWTFCRKRRVLLRGFFCPVGTKIIFRAECRGTPPFAGILLPCRRRIPFARRSQARFSKRVLGATPLRENYPPESFRSLTRVSENELIPFTVPERNAWTFRRKRRKVGVQNHKQRAANKGTPG